MVTAAPLLTGEDFVSRVKELKERQETITARVNRVNAKLEERKVRLREVEDKAEKEFGTRDPKALRLELTRREQANNDKLLAFEKDIEASESQVSALEKALEGNVA